MRHPLHPALVHFPVACWSLATAADLAGVHFGTPAWHLAGIMLVIGLVMSIPALLAGMYELTRVAEESPAWRTIYLHMGTMSVALTLYAISLFARLDHTTLLEPDSLAVACSVCGFIALALGGWFGGKLVYVHGLGR